MAVTDAYAEAQAAVIGSVLIDPEPTVGIVMDALRPEHFREDFRTVFEAVRGLWLERKPIDPVAVIHAAGSAYAGAVREWMKLTPTAANVAAYCAIVRDESSLDRLRSAGLALAGAATIEEARELLRKMEPAMVERTGIRTMTAMEMILDFQRRAQDRTPPDYLPWGMRKLDQALTAERGDFIVIGADSSVGKTALAVQFAWHMAGHGKRVGFFSLETSIKKLADRLVAQQAKVSLEDIKRKSLGERDWQEIGALGSGAQKIPLSVSECAGCGVPDLRALCIANRYDVVFVDYLQLLKGEGKERWEIVTGLSMALHLMAQELGVAVIALSQLTTEKGTKARRQPSKDDLRESRQLKQDADVIMLMSLVDPENNNGLRWLKVDKNKDGALADLCLKFDAEHMTFTPTDSRALERWVRENATRKPKFTELPDEKQEELPW